MVFIIMMLTTTILQKYTISDLGNVFPKKVQSSNEVLCLSILWKLIQVNTYE